MKGSPVEFQIVAGELCLDFINTLDNRPSPGRLKELLPAYLDLVEWALQAGAIASAQGSALRRAAADNPKAAESVRQKGLKLRECLYRVVVSALHHRRPTTEDVTLFSHYLGDALSNLELRNARSGFRLDWRDSSPRLDSLLWPVVKSASQLLTSPDLERVRECASPSCRWLFVDRSKNHSRRWCDMKACGNRVKARRFYSRKSDHGRNETRLRRVST